jgi:hypothetical protein
LFHSWEKLSSDQRNSLFKCLWYTIIDLLRTNDSTFAGIHVKATKASFGQKFFFINDNIASDITFILTSASYNFSDHFLLECLDSTWNHAFHNVIVRFPADNGNSSLAKFDQTLD